MTKKLKIGDKAWCIKASMESEGYGDNSPKLPWLGTVTDASHATEHVSLSRDDGEGNPDEDSNATAGCWPQELFKTKEEACQAWNKAIRKYIIEKEKELESLKRELKLNQSV